MFIHRWTNREKVSVMIIPSILEESDEVDLAATTSPGEVTTALILEDFVIAESLLRTVCICCPSVP